MKVQDLVNYLLNLTNKGALGLKKKDLGLIFFSSGLWVD